MNDPVEHATGIEKWELEQKIAGNEVSAIIFMKAGIKKECMCFC